MPQADKAVTPVVKVVARVAYSPAPSGPDDMEALGPLEERTKHPPHEVVHLP